MTGFFCAAPDSKIIKIYNKLSYLGGNYERRDPYKNKWVYDFYPGSAVLFSISGI